MNPKPMDRLPMPENGGCSAKLPAGALDQLLQSLALPIDERVLVDVSAHDDAGVIQVRDDLALVFTTDFFSPICDDPFRFGQIAAANAMSDVYAMGAKPLMALNINMFPSESYPLTLLKSILEGGQSKINEAGALTMGGHTIVDPIPKYGLAVLGTVHPKELISNAGLRPGEVLVLTKPIGCGVTVAAHRMGLVSQHTYETVLDSMATLNQQAAACMHHFGVRGATDITGFGLLGHCYSMAKASKVSIRLQTHVIPVFPEVLSLLDMGCVPATVWRNLEFVQDHLKVEDSVDLVHKLICADAQTSGGLLMGVPREQAKDFIRALKDQGVEAVDIGEVCPQHHHDWVTLC